MNALSVQPGGPGMNEFGMRATPSLRYVHVPQAFTEHYIDLMDNNGQDSGQTVFHLHVHILAGRPFRWPPG